MIGDIASDLLHAFDAELLLPNVLGLAKPVGIEEDAVATMELQVLRREVETSHHTNGDVGVAGESGDTTIADQQRRVVPGIRETQATGVEIKDGDEEGDEHASFVVAADGFVEGNGNLIRLLRIGRNIAEQVARDSHQQRCWNTFSRDIADAEEETFIADEEVVEVATDSLGWHDRAVNIDIMALGEDGIILGKHRHLYVVRNLEFALY